MSSLALTAALCLADPAASRVDVSGGVSVEVRGGRAPVRPAEPPVFSVLTIVNPDVDMEFASRRGTTFNLGYTPRVQYRNRNRVSNLQRPLLLHQAYSTLVQQIDPRWALGVNLGGSIGEADYNSVPILIDDNAQAPDVDVLQIAAVSAGMNVEGRLTRRHTLGIRTNVVYRTPFDVPEPEMPDPDVPDDEQRALGGLPEQLNANAGVSLNTRITPLDAIEVEASPGYFNANDGGAQFVTAQVTGQWQRQIRPSLASALGLGVFGSAGVGGTRTQSAPVMPVALASVTGGLLRRATHNVDATLTAGLTPFFDRVQVSLDPRATLNATVEVAIPPRWTVRVLAGGVTNATATPRQLDGGASAAQQTETQVRLSLPVTYQISEQQQFEFGLLLAARAPHLRSPELELNQGETWLYVAYRIGAGTARGGREVGQSGRGAITRSARGENDAVGGGRQ
jgi:hypothetical protein